MTEREKPPKGGHYILPASEWREQSGKVRTDANMTINWIYAVVDRNLQHFEGNKNITDRLEKLKAQIEKAVETGRDAAKNRITAVGQTLNPDDPTAVANKLKKETATAVSGNESIFKELKLHIFGGERKDKGALYGKDKTMERLYQLETEVIQLGSKSTTEFGDSVVKGGLHKLGTWLGANTATEQLNATKKVVDQLSGEVDDKGKTLTIKQTDAFFKYVEEKVKNSIEAQVLLTAKAIILESGGDASKGVAFLNNMNPTTMKNFEIKLQPDLQHQILANLQQQQQPAPTPQPTTQPTTQPVAQFQGKHTLEGRFVEIAIILKKIENTDKIKDGDPLLTKANTRIVAYFTDVNALLAVAKMSQQERDDDEKSLKAINDEVTRIGSVKHLATAEMPPSQEVVDKMNKWMVRLHNGGSISNFIDDAGTAIIGHYKFKNEDFYGKFNKIWHEDKEALRDWLQAHGLETPVGNVTAGPPKLFKRP